MGNACQEFWTGVFERVIPRVPPVLTTPPSVPQTVPQPATVPVTPSTNTITVQPGDTLSELTAEHGIDLRNAQIRRNGQLNEIGANGIDANQIQPGDEIVTPQTQTPTGADQVAQAAEETGGEGDVEQSTSPCCPPPHWMPIAWGELGVAETPGNATTPRVMEYHRASGFTWERESSPGSGDMMINDSRSVDAWCSSFVTWTLMQAGYTRADLATNPFRAREYNNRWANGTNCGDPIYGCLGVQQNHVGFIVGHHPDNPNKLAMLGGNQGNQVKVSYYMKSAFLGFWVPSDYPHACCELGPYNDQVTGGSQESTR